MNIDTAELQDRLCKEMCSSISLREDAGGRFVLATPFEYADGDQYVLYLEEQLGGVLKLSDYGHTLMQLSYENDIDAFRTGGRGRLFDSTLAGGGVEEEDGELFILTSAGGLSQSVFRMSQVITKISDLTFLNRNRVESTFYEDLESALAEIARGIEITKDYLVPGVAEAKQYSVDYRVPGKINDLYIFGLPNKEKVLRTTITIGHLLRSEVNFESLLVFADQSSIPSSDLARLTNVGGEMVSSLSATEDLERKILKRAAIQTDS